MARCANIYKTNKNGSTFFELVDIINDNKDEKDKEDEKDKLPNIDINCRLTYKYGYTALHYACKEGFTDIVKELLKLPNINVNCRAFNNTKEVNRVGKKY